MSYLGKVNDISIVMEEDLKVLYRSSLVVLLSVEQQALRSVQLVEEGCNWASWQ